MLALGIVILAYGFLWIPVGFAVMAVGAGIMFWAIFGWAMEDIDHPMGDADAHGGGHGDAGSGEPEAAAEDDLVSAGAEGGDE